MAHRIDVHHHALPTRYLARVGAETLGRLLVSGKAPQWAPDISLAAMDRNGIAKAYLSMSAPGVSTLGETEAVETASEFNDDLAAICRRDPQRFGGFAYLPLPYRDAALAEIERAYGELGCDGVCMLASHGPLYLGDPAFAPVFAELDRRGAIVFVHPDEGPGSWAIPGVPAATLDFPIDTTRAILSLMMAGILQRLPRIRFIFSHAGGTLPFLAERFARLERIPANRELLAGGVVAILSRLYLDTALSANGFIFPALLKLVGHEHVLFGSDYPFAPEDTMAASVAGLGALPLAPAERAAIERGNALSLFGTAAEAPLETGR